MKQNLDEQTEVKDKIYNIILSCNRKDQLVNVERWITNIYESYDKVSNEKIRENSQCILKGFLNLTYSLLRKCEEKEVA